MLRKIWRSRSDAEGILLSECVETSVVYVLLGKDGGGCSVLFIVAAKKQRDEVTLIPDREGHETCPVFHVRAKEEGTLARFRSRAEAGQDTSSCESSIHSLGEQIRDLWKMFLDARS